MKNKLKLINVLDCRWDAVYTGETGAGEQVSKEEAHFIAGESYEERSINALLVWGADLEDTEISVTE